MRTATAPDLTHSRRYGTSVLPHAPYGRWATRAGRSPGSRLERPTPAFPRRITSRHQWHCGGSLPPTVAGAAAASELTSMNRVPFSPVTSRSVRRVPSRSPRKARCAHKSQLRARKNAEHVPQEPHRASRRLLHGFLDDLAQHLVHIREGSLRLRGCRKGRPVSHHNAPGVRQRFVDEHDVGAEGDVG